MYIYLAHTAALVLFMLAAGTASSQNEDVESELSSTASPRWQDHMAFTQARDGAWPQYISVEVCHRKVALCASWLTLANLRCGTAGCQDTSLRSAHALKI